MHISHVLAGLLLLAAVPAAHAAQSYDNCTGHITSLPATITTQGTWCLSQDVSTAITTGAAITIGTNNVTLDCNHFKLGGLAAGAGTVATGILVNNRTNFAMRQCTVRGFMNGMRLQGGGGGHLVEKNVFQGNTYSAITLAGVDGVVIRDNLVNDTGGSSISNNPRAIWSDAMVSGLVISGNTINGIKPGSGEGNATAISVETDGALVEGNRIFDVLATGDGTATGIALGEYGKAIGNTLDSVVGLTSYGIACEPSFERSFVRDNVLTRTGNAFPFSCVDGGGNSDY